MAQPISGNSSYWRVFNMYQSAKKSYLYQDDDYSVAEMQSRGYGASADLAHRMFDLTGDGKVSAAELTIAKILFNHDQDPTKGWQDTLGYLRSGGNESDLIARYREAAGKILTPLSSAFRSIPFGVA